MKAESRSPGKVVRKNVSELIGNLRIEDRLGMAEGRAAVKLLECLVTGVDDFENGVKVNPKALVG